MTNISRLKVSHTLNDILIVGNKSEKYDIEIQCDIIKELGMANEEEDEIDTGIVPKTTNSKKRGVIIASYLYSNLFLYRALGII